MMRLVLKLSCLVLLASFLTTLAFGQLEAGSISGTVKDATGAVIPGAAVKVKSTATGAERSTQTGNVGQYLIPGLTPGFYEMTITSGSFAPFKARTEVTVGGLAVVDAQLAVGKEATTIEVVAQGAAEVNTQTQELSTLIDTQQLASLPSLSRNPYDFVAISGNVSAGDNTTNSANSGQSLSNRGVGFSINGQRESGTEILLDGVENVGAFSAGIGEQIPVDAVQEYSVITNNFSAEYGRASGGVVNLSSKGGTNNLHGSAWEFNRLSKYTANTYANDAANAACLTAGTCTNATLPDPKGGYTRNVFGFQVGGPVIKNKLFFFESTEWTRVRSSATETEEVLDPTFVSGNSATGWPGLPANIQSYLSTYGTGGLTGPVTALSTPAALGLTGNGICLGQTVGTTAGTAACLNGTTLIPATQAVFDTVNFKAPFDAGGDVPQNTYRLVGRLDFNLSEKTQMFFRAGRESVEDFLGTAFYTTYPQYQVGTGVLNQSYLYSISHSFNSNLFNNTKISFTRFNTANSFNTALTSTPNLMIVPPTDPVTSIYIQTPGLENYGEPGEGGLPYGGPQNTWQLEHDLSWIKGRHSMKFGGQITYMQLNVSYGAYAQAVEQLGATFLPSMYSLVNAADNIGGSPLIAFASRVNPDGAVPCHTNPDGSLIPSSACAVTPPLQSADYARSYRYKDWAVYGQDSFRITPRLTINYGLRYEHYGVQHNSDPSLDSNFYYGSGAGMEQQVRNGNLYIADKSPVGGFWAPRWGTAAPRLGFAYDVFGDGKSSLRGGFGISYERNFGNVTYNASFNPPASAVINKICVPNANGTVGGSTTSTACPVLATNADLGLLGLPGPPSYLPPVELRNPNPNINVAQTQFWSLDLQRQLARNTIFDIGYSGAHGVHLYDIENINLLGAGQYYLGDPTTFPGFADCNYTPGPGVIPPCLTRPNNQFSNINMRGSLGNSSYSGLNLKLQTQNIHDTGLSLVANYTWAHSLDDLSSTFSDSLQGGSGVIGSLGYTDFMNPMLDWGSSDYDIRQRFVVSPIWETPWYKSGKGPIHQVLGGWSLTGIITARTGVPFSVYDYTNDANFYTVPRLTPATAITSYHVGSPQIAGTNIFNVLSVPVPASFAPLDSTLQISDFGPFPANMTHRNAFRGPGAWNSDLALGKSFKVTERVGLDFRAEGFDVFNHHNYYVNVTETYYDGATTTPLEVTALKGGLGTLATGGNHDERRFGQFSLRVSF